MFISSDSIFCGVCVSAARVARPTEELSRALNFCGKKKEKMNQKKSSKVLLLLLLLLLLRLLLLLILLRVLRLCLCV